MADYCANAEAFIERILHDAALQQQIEVIDHQPGALLDLASELGLETSEGALDEAVRRRLGVARPLGEEELNVIAGGLPGVEATFSRTLRQMIAEMRRE